LPITSRVDNAIFATRAWRTTQNAPEFAESQVETRLHHHMAWLDSKTFERLQLGACHER
jgi:hypothetical protein